MKHLVLCALAAAGCNTFNPFESSPVDAPPDAGDDITDDASPDGAPGPHAELAADRAEFSYGEMPTDAHGTVYLRFTNNGEVPTSELAVWFSGPDQILFSIFDDDCSDRVLAARGYCEIGVELVPTTVGEKIAKLVVTADEGGTATVNLDGTGYLASDLHVAVGGSGTGVVHFAGVTCPPTLGMTYHAGTAVELSAEATGGGFSRWSVESCGSAPTCTMTATARHESVTAYFEPYRTLSVVAGAGTTITVTGPTSGTCTDSCSYSEPDLSWNTVHADVAPGLVFMGWTGAACVGAESDTCTFQMTGHEIVRSLVCEEWDQCCRFGECEPPPPPDCVDNCPPFIDQ